MTVIKDTGERALHPALRRGARGAARVGAALRLQGDRPERRGVGGGAGVPTRALQPLRRARLPRAQVRDRVRRPGRRLRPRRGLGRGALALGGQRRRLRRHRRPRRDRDAADLEVRDRGAEAALAGPRDQGRADRRPRHHRAGRRLRRRLAQHHGQEGQRRLRRQRRPRPSSPTASAPTSWSAAVKTTEEGGHHGISFLVLEREMPGYEVVNKLEKMGWHSSDTGELQLHRRRGARGEPARARRTRASS